MKINLQNAGKRYNREWIFRNASMEFEAGRGYAITGPNGSGKSTLLQALGGMLQLSEGSIGYAIKAASLSPEKIYRHISLCAPYLEVVEEMTLFEFLQFHSRFKSFYQEFTTVKVIAEIGLEKAATKQIRNFSSGMRQRVKLAQAILFDAAVVLLDEPCSNLDSNGIELYHRLIKTYCSNRLVIVCSNDTAEYSFCKEIVSMLSFKDGPAVAHDTQ